MLCACPSPGAAEFFSHFWGSIFNMIWTGTGYMEDLWRTYFYPQSFMGDHQKTHKQAIKLHQIGSLWWCPLFLDQTFNTRGTRAMNITKPKAGNELRTSATSTSAGGLWWWKGLQNSQGPRMKYHPWLAQVMNKSNTKPWFWFFRVFEIRENGIG